MTGSAREKARLRQEALERRNALDRASRAQASHRVAREVVRILDLRPETVVAGFLPIRTEIDVRPLLETLAERGARLCVPAIVADELEFRELTPDAALVPQGFGTSAPGLEAAVLHPDVMLVPFAAFDRRLHRIGYGRGYYDRAIARLRGIGAAPLAVGVGFACQAVGAVPDEPHDVPLDVIATECEVLRRS